MRTSPILFTIGCLGVAVASAMIGSPASSQNYPAKPVKIITHSAPGGAPDVIARIVADWLTRSWGQQVVVLNHPGAGGAIAARVAAASPPDGYTLYMPAASAFVVLPEITANLPLDLKRDFVPIGLVGEAPLVIAVASSLGIASLPELISLARKRPGEILYATTGHGTLTHLTGELLQSRTGIQLLMIPYPGPAQALNDIRGGRVFMVVAALSGISGVLQGGGLKAIAVASAKRLPNFPDLPTMSETIPGFVATGWFALVAPAGTPEAILQKVSNDLRSVIEQPEIKSRFATLGTYVRPMSPKELTEFIAGEQRLWNPLLKQIGVMR